MALKPHIRRIPYADAPGITSGRSFGDHYVNQNYARYPLLAEQVTVTVYPEGNRMLVSDGSELSRWRTEPHVEVRAFIGGQWETRSRTFIGK